MARVVLKDFLDEKGIKSKWLAAKLGMSSAALSKILNGKTDYIKLDFIENVCRELDCNMSDVVKLDVEK